MGKLAILIVILMMAVLGMFAVFNTDSTTVNIPFDQPYEISKIGLMLFSSVFGAGAMLLLFIIRDTKRFMVMYQYQRKQKKEEKVQALYLKAVNAILANDEAEATATLHEILKVEPEYTDALLRLGDLAARKEQHEEASGYFKRAHTSGPKNLEPLFSLECTMERMGKRDDALEYVEKILDIHPDNLSALYKKRSLLEAQAKWDDVIDVQKTILKHEQDGKAKEREQEVLLGYRYELARDSFERGEIEKANKGFRTILREDEDFLPAYLGVAEIMLAEGESESAVSYLESAYETTSAITILARLEDLLITLGEPSRLIRTYRKAVSDKPQNELLRFLLGKLYFRLEMIDDALETLLPLDTTENYPDVHKLLGELYLRREQCDRAVEHFKKPLRLGKSLRVPYGCGICGHKKAEWSGRCPSCNNWNTYKLRPDGPIKV